MREPPQLIGVRTPAAPAPVLSWLARPEPFGMSSSARTRTQAMFRRPYRYAEGGSGLVDVPVPVWYTKAFTSSWEAEFAQLPLEARLQYNPRNPDQPFFGTIKSNLPVDLEEVGLVVGNKVYQQVDLRKDGPPLTVDLKAGEARELVGSGTFLQPAQVAHALVGMFGTRRVYRTLPASRGGLFERGCALFRGKGRKSHAYVTSDVELSDTDR